MNAGKIKTIREEEEITQKEMATKLGVTRSAYSLWEINKNTIPLYYLNELSNYHTIFINVGDGISITRRIKDETNMWCKFNSRG